MKLVITGSPDSGKTTLCHVLQCQFSHDVVAIPDPMDIVNTQFIPEGKNKSAQKSRQKAFYHLRKEVEDLYLYNDKKKLFICDRGSLDYLASWPDTPKSFFHETHSSLKNELKRYDWVIALKGNSTEVDLNTPAFRDPQAFWEQHPNYISIFSDFGFSLCSTAVANIVKKILSGFDREEIMSGLHHLNTRDLKLFCETNQKHREARSLI